MKLKLLLVLFILVFALTACSTNDSDSPPATDTDQENTDPINPGNEDPADDHEEPDDSDDDTMHILPMPSDDDEDAVSIMPVPSDDEEDAVSIMPVDENHESKKGIYTGRIDTRSIEFLSDGEYHVLVLFMDDEERFGNFESMTAMEIFFETNNIGENTVVKMVKAPDPGTPESIGKESSGSFITYIGDDKMEVKVNDNYKLFWIAKELLDTTEADLTINTVIDFSYFTDEYGRNVITGYSVE